jgi:hypothetical protein
LCGSVDELIAKNELVIVGNSYPHLREKLQSLNGNLPVLDLVGIVDDGKLTSSYHGISW